eukprot:m.231390 g.231390  ORF g.231390 m.231390 type:complete len:88 (+) comp40067_c6_seq21:740-1003(+)
MMSSGVLFISGDMGPLYKCGYNQDTVFTSSQAIASAVRCCCYTTLAWHFFELRLDSPAQIKQKIDRNEHIRRKFNFRSPNSGWLEID